MTSNPDAAYSHRLIGAVNAAMRSAATITGGADAAAFGGPLDSKRAGAWCEYGWPTTLDFDDFLNLYSRQGIAFGIVNKLAEKCWEDAPRLIDGEEAEIAKPQSPWEKATKKILKNARFWKAYNEADIRRMVSGWAAILVQMADDSAQAKWDQPVTGKPRILKLTPAWSGQLTPEVDQVTGAVTHWNYREADGADATGTVLRDLKIHPDRILLVGDWRTGVSMLRAPFNAFVNLEKIGGGSGESFLKNAARQLGINFDKDTDLRTIASAYGVKPEDLQEIFNSTAKRINQGSDLILATQGAEVKPLVAAVTDPKNHIDVNVQEVAASFRIPVKIVVGMQTGERASSEDIKDFNKRGQQRRVQDLSYDIQDSIDQLIRIQAIPEAPGAEYYVHWSDLTQATDEEKLANAAKLAEINKNTVGTGEPPPFTSDEIREAAGYEAMADAQGEDTGEGPLPEPPADAPETDA